MPTERDYMDQQRMRLSCGVAAYLLNAAAEDVMGPTRGEARTAYARQLAMYFCHVVFAMSLARTGVAFSRDRSTVAYACRIIEDKRDDAGFDAWLARAEDALRTAPPPATLTQGARS